MKHLKLTSLLMMLLVAFTAAGQEEFFDDVYFSSDKKDKKEQKEEKVIQPKEEKAQETLSSTYTSSSRVETAQDNSEWDVDAYNRRYEEDYDSADGEVLAEYNDEMAYDEADTVIIDSQNERRSDLEYTERIVRYHSPSKITVAGADAVNLYLDDGYYAYGYDTDYTDGNVNVNVNIDMGYGGWYSPWYWSSWYDPWYYRWYSPWYSPWYWSSWYDPWYWGPSWGFGWGWGGFYAAASTLATGAVSMQAIGMAAIGGIIIMYRLVIIEMMLDAVLTLIITEVVADEEVLPLIGVDQETIILGQLHH